MEETAETKAPEQEKAPKHIPQWIFGCITAVLAVAAVWYTLHWEETLGSFGCWMIILALAITVCAFMKSKMNWIAGIVSFALTPIAAFFAMECLTHDAWEMYISPIILNIILFYCFFFFFFAVTGSMKWGSIISTLLAVFVGMANYFTILCRNSPILPWDIKSAGTALSVSSNYKLSIDWRVCLILLLFLAMLVLAQHNPVTIKRLPFRIGAAVISVVLVLSMNALTHNDKFEARFMTFSNLFTQIYTYRDNGFAISFMLNLQYMEISKPAGYRTDAAAETYQQAYEEYKAEHGISEAETKPNIIIIMDESFTDLAYLHEFATCDEEGNLVDYMPFIHSLMSDENVISGNLYVSVCGGNTANSEFEVLTGNTMAFLPTGSVAYQQYISGELPSLATVLKQQGYQTTGIHPYYASGWDRDDVYPWLGIDTALFRDSFVNAKLVRKYISDESAFDKIIEVCRQNQGTPQFIFEVTMQNHGGYSEIFDNSPIEIYLRDIENRPATENYLTLVSKTDSALAELFAYFEQVDEPTIILFFGDHQPSDYVSTCILNLTGKTYDEMTLTERQSRYKVPFIIWSNYDTGNEAVKYDMLSANYLSSILLEEAGLSMNAYQMYLLALMEEYPVITANGYADSDGYFYPYERSSAPDALKEYERLQYNYLFDDQSGCEEYYNALTQ